MDVYCSLVKYSDFMGIVNYIIQALIKEYYGTCSKENPADVPSIRLIYYGDEMILRLVKFG